MSLTHWRAPTGTVRKMSLSAGRRLHPRGHHLLWSNRMLECVQPVLHYYPACALNVSWRRRDDSIDLMKVLFIFLQILSPVITQPLQYCSQRVPNLSVRGDSLPHMYATLSYHAYFCRGFSISHQTVCNCVKTCPYRISSVKLMSPSELTSKCKPSFTGY